MEIKLRFSANYRLKNKSILCFPSRYFLILLFSQERHQGSDVGTDIFIRRLSHFPPLIKIASHVSKHCFR